MDFWHVFLLITTCASLITAGICLYLLRKMDLEKARMENYLISISLVMSDYWNKIEALFEQSIHYYDETIFQFIESTKEVKLEIDKTLDQYEDLREYIVPIQTPEEKRANQEQELLGVVKNYPITKSLEVPKR